MVCSTLIQKSGFLSSQLEFLLECPLNLDFSLGKSEQPHQPLDCRKTVELLLCPATVVDL